MNELGITKKQVQTIIRIAKGKNVEYRKALQGIMYHAETKKLFVSNGYFAYVWDMKDYSGELPTIDQQIHYTKLNAWQINAKAKDVLSFGEIFTMGEDGQVPNITKIIEEAVSTDKAPKIDLELLASISGLFPQQKAQITQKDITGNGGLVFEVLDTIYKQTLVVMGCK